MPHALNMESSAWGKTITILLQITCVDLSEIHAPVSCETVWNSCLCDGFTRTKRDVHAGFCAFARPSKPPVSCVSFRIDRARRREGNEAKPVCTSDISAWTLCRARDLPGKHNTLFHTDSQRNGACQHISGLCVKNVHGP